MLSVFRNSVREIEKVHHLQKMATDTFWDIAPELL